MGARTPQPEIVVAVSRNGAIARAGRIPWRLPGDLRRFRALTMGGILVMGRITHQSIDRDLPGRGIIVVSARGYPSGPRHDVADSLDDAVLLARGRPTGPDDPAATPPPVFIVGGQRIYDAALATPRLSGPQQLPSYIRRIHMTLVDAHVDGDALFPPHPGEGWRCVAAETPPPHPADEHPYRFLTWGRD